MSLPPAPIAAPRDTSVNAVAMRWSGSLQGYLDLVTDQLSLAWEYRDGVVVIERFRTEFFEIAALESETDYHLGLSGADQANATSSGNGGGGTNSTASSSNEVSEHGKSNAVASILATIHIQDVPGSSAVRSEGTGRIAVTSSKETLSKVRDFVRVENESLLRQAQVQFDIYSVTRNESDERGIEWNAVLSALGGAYTASLGSPATLASATASNIGFSILTPAQSGVTTSLTAHLGGSSALLKLLSEFGVSTQHREVSLLALNRTWDRKSSLGGRAYVSSTIPGRGQHHGRRGPRPGHVHGHHGRPLSRAAVHPRQQHGAAEVRHRPVVAREPGELHVRHGHGAADRADARDERDQRPVHRGAQGRPDPGQHGIESPRIQR